jgi:hypothetical protein
MTNFQQLLKSETWECIYVKDNGILNTFINIFFNIFEESLPGK